MLIKGNIDIQYWTILQSLNLIDLNFSDFQFSIMYFDVMNFDGEDIFCT